MSRLAGIAGAPGRTAEVERMLDAMRGRVPVTSHVRAAGRAALGVSTWRSPQLVEAHGVVVAVDGDVFDAPDDGTGDPATRVAALYARLGFADTMRAINGELAVALYDPRTDTLWLGRDRFATKPMYYAARSGWLAFGSRPRALLALPEVPSTPSPAFVARFAGLHYRTFDNAPRESPYAEIAQLPAASYLEVRGGAVVREAEYWALVEQPDLTDDEATLAERYRELLIDAVARRRRPAVRPAFTLSGGMDSSSVLVASVHMLGGREHAYSTVYQDATYDESDQIRTMLAQNVEEWHTVRIGNPDLAAVIPRMIEDNDEPVATATWLSHYVLCDQVHRDGFGSLFGGLGGDELNAGEYEYFFFFFADLAAAGEDARLAHETAKWVEYHDHPIFKKSPAVMRAGLERLVDLSRPGVCLPDPSRLARYRETVRPEYFDLSTYAPVMDAPFTSYLKNRTHQDIFRETAPCCLRAADRQTTAFGLDVVWPFFDHRLVELMFRIPSTLKIRDGVTKHLLREAMRGILPESTRGRVQKTGWNAPAHVWFATGPGRELALDLIGSQAFRERGIYDEARVRALLDQHREIVTSGRPEDNHMMFLWQMVNLELWLRAL